VLQYTAASTGGVLALVKPGSIQRRAVRRLLRRSAHPPMTNGTTGNKQLYLVTRYVDAANWYGAA
jgi:pectate lyase